MAIIQLLYSTTIQLWWYWCMQHAYWTRIKQITWNQICNNWLHWQISETCIWSIFTFSLICCFYCMLYLACRDVLQFKMSVPCRDGLKTFWVEIETKTETWAPETETRPRRLPNCPRRDRDETLECPRRDRDETFFWSRLYRDTWLIDAWYMHFTLCPQKKNPLD